jgi:hypothetical protein
MMIALITMAIMEHLAILIATGTEESNKKLSDSGHWGFQEERSDYPSYTNAPRVFCVLSAPILWLL